MTPKEKATLNRLAKKLSAIRATLKKDERDMLDRLILGEVGGHALKAGKPQKALKMTQAETAAHSMTGSAASMKVSRASKATTEVAAHSMIIPNQAQAVNAMKAAKTDMVAHSMKAGAATAKVAGPRQASTAQAAAASAASASAALLQFDATTGGYTVNDSATI